MLLAGTAAVMAVAACRASFDVTLFTILAPARVSAQSTYGEIRISWDPVAGVTAPYQLESISGGMPSRVAVDGTSYLLVAVSGSDVSLSVAGVDPNGIGPFSPPIFARPLSGPPFKANPDGTISTPTYSYGFSVATGDFDGDGVDDLVAGAPFAGNTNSGYVNTYFGTTAGVLAQGDELVFADVRSNFGYTLASGEFDLLPGAEIVVGAMTYDGGGVGNSDYGLIQVYSGDLTPLGAGLVGPLSTRLGYALATGDIAGNAIDDILGCAPFGGANRFLVHQGLPGTGAEVSSPSGGCTAAALPGDVTGDGFPDAVIGNGFAPVGGQILVAAGPTFAVANEWFRSEVVSEDLGGRQGSIVAAGDVNGDGRADVVVSAPSYSLAGYAVLLLATDGRFVESSWRVSATSSGTFFGFAMATADLNGDGWLELAIGDPDFGVVPGPSNYGRGRVLLYRGVEGGFEAAPWWTTEGATDQRVGWSLAFGDVDGSGYRDLVVGSPKENGGARRVLTWHAAPGEGPLVNAGPAGTTDVDTPWVPAAELTDPANRISRECLWDWDGDGTFDETIPACVSPAKEHVYTTRGVFHPKLRVEALDGRYGESVTTVIVR